MRLRLSSVRRGITYEYDVGCVHLCICVGEVDARWSVFSRASYHHPHNLSLSCVCLSLSLSLSLCTFGRLQAESEEGSPNARGLSEDGLANGVAQRCEEREPVDSAVACLSSKASAHRIRSFIDQLTEMDDVQQDHFLASLSQPDRVGIDITVREMQDDFFN